ncbi:MULTISPECIES: hypothetical protein [unclassified Pseudofrankia]|uniref:hypothetical protein n=1 Tax=unclassified Pseudofrankia TaxID=2994372 RepID=UPI0008D98C04|nr:MULTISPECIES: hypothetical protein [unclassified Pseudofrankia]MDT3446143.1 hypothetical protein [Pseudofrankia sp. BMG5.37]OHV62271.1 hypothetical protein BCD48_39390 [Pseudofrankia sp. BMG5.36]
MNAMPTHGAARVLIVGRSPGVLMAAVDMLRAKGYLADATNQFGQVLDDYDVSDLDVLVFGGMVPADTKQYLRDEISRRNSGVTFVQGLAGIAGVIAAQVEVVTCEDPSDAAEITYDAAERTHRVSLSEAAHVTVEALWATSFTPPEPTSTSMQVFDGDLAAGSHDIALPDTVPSEASFATVTVGSQVHVFTVGPMPDSVTRLVPTSATDRRLPDVAAVTVHSDEQ